MESIIVACITGVVTLVGVILSNSKSRAVMEVKLDTLTAKVKKHNQVLERTYRLEQDMAVAKHDIECMPTTTEETMSRQTHPPGTPTGSGARPPTRTRSPGPTWCGATSPAPSPPTSSSATSPACAPARGGSACPR